MCLIVDKAQHPNYIPIVLEKDLYVTKYLSHNYSTNLFKSKWITPSQKKPVKFIFGKAILKAKIKGEDVIDDGHHCLKINEGIHSMTFSWEYFCETPFRAKIPKGTKVYYGTKYDIVSEKLIIYK